ncbi:MAG TPA: hypothetical protein VIK33_17200 [Anaerolineae bacterium]
MTPETLQQLIRIFSAALLALALGIVLIADIRKMIRLYQFQSLLLASVALLTAVEREEPLMLGAMIPPLLLLATIEIMLARATIPPPGSDESLHLKRSYRHTLLPQAASFWLRHSPGQVHAGVGFVDLGLVMTTYVIAFRPAEAPYDQFSLILAVGLLVLGLFALGTQRNLIAQVMGLLVAEHGLFLAVVRVVPAPALTVFIVSLLLYILLTLMILFVLLPDLHRASGSIDVNDQRELRG